MPAKTPMYLKTTTPKRGKRLKLRDFLSGDMISPPMGEVRHSAHVGPEGEGDMFGDVGFLRGKLDMLPATRGRGGRSQSVESRLEGECPATKGSLSYSYHGNHHAATGLLKTTVSMPVFVSHEQAPPKPPRLHLDEPGAPPPPAAAPPPPLRTTTPSLQNFTQPLHHQNQTELPPHQNQTQLPHQNQTQVPPHQNHHVPGKNGHGHANAQTNGHGTHHRSYSLWDHGVAGQATSDLHGSPSLRRLVPSSGSFSEASSEDSASECCGPLDPRRGLSLDSDAGLSNEDLRSDSPCPVSVATAADAVPCGLSPGAAVSRSESLAGLDLDLGPSILDDVLGIMDRYTTP